MWSVYVSVGQGQHVCPDCHGTRTWTATSPVGETFAINCLRCSTSYACLPRDVPPLAYQKSEYSAQQLTIGSVQIDTADERSQVKYMCRETGVGSGRVYDERDLFADEADARRSAEEQTRVYQAKLDAGPINPIRAEAATWTLSAAFPHVWQEEIYHAWDRFRALKDACDEVLHDRDDTYELSSNARELIGEALEPKPWLRPNPVARLVREVTVYLDEPTDERLKKMRSALSACIPPEHRSTHADDAVGQRVG